MSSRLYAAIAASAAACLSFAAPAHAQEREAVQSHVEYADLNLATPEGRAVLRARVHQAAVATCAPIMDNLAGKLDSARCLHEMEHDGTTKVAALIRATPTQLAASR